MFIVSQKKCSGALGGHEGRKEFFDFDFDF
jgi:hypothetical protein